MAFLLTKFINITICFLFVEMRYLTSNIKMMLKRLPKVTTSFYFIAGMLFLFWMLFLDSNDLYTQYKLRGQLKALNHEKEFYQEKIEEVKQEREQLLTNTEALEKFAREKYLMKKESEDLFVIVEE
jgi:cell division protein DivIC